MSYQNNSSVWRIDWTDELSVYIQEIDAEHQNFIRLVNELNEAILWRMELGQVKRCMQATLDDAAAHFDHEEALLKERCYPGAEEHAQKHAQILRDLREIMGYFEHDETEYVWIDAGLKVKHTLIEHLLTEDMKYRDYCIASGGRPKGKTVC